VSTEPKTICLEIDADPRLAAAAGGAARYVADAAGLESEAISQLQSATVSVCARSFENLAAGHAWIEVTVSHFPDRIEVAVSHWGQGGPAIGLDAIAGFAAQVGGDNSEGASLAGVDRVQFDTQGSNTVTRLIKYLGPSAAGL
jgi:hypothetical protein